MGDDLDAGPETPSEAGIASRRRRMLRERRDADRRRRLARTAPWALALALLVVSAAAATIAVRDTGRVVPKSASGNTATALSAEREFATGGPGSQPTGIAVSGDRLYVADPAHGVVGVLTRQGSRVATIGAGFLAAPVYVAVGPVDGRVYVSDRVKDTVAVYAASGKLFGVLTPDGVRARPALGRSWKPLALGFAPDGTLYVADSAGDQTIAVFSPAGSRTGTLGADVPVGRSGRRLAFPNGIAASAERIVVADSNNGRLLVFDSSGRYVTAIAIDGLPRGVALLDGGRVIITDAATNEVSLITSAGAPVARLERTAAGTGFMSLAGLAVDEEGQAYVSDTAAGRIDVVLTSPAASPRAASPAGPVPWSIVAIVSGLLAMAVAAVATARSRAGTRARARTL